MFCLYIKYHRKDVFKIGKAEILFSNNSVYKGLSNSRKLTKILKKGMGKLNGKVRLFHCKQLWNSGIIIHNTYLHNLFGKNLCAFQSVGGMRLWPQDVTCWPTTSQRLGCMRLEDQKLGPSFWMFIRSRWAVSTFTCEQPWAPYFITSVGLSI